MKMSKTVICPMASKGVNIIVKQSEAQEMLLHLKSVF